MKSSHKNETNIQKKHKQYNTNIKHPQTMARWWNNLRLYKGKETKGKCSNECGITLAGNLEKYLKE